VFSSCCFDGQYAVLAALVMFVSGPDGGMTATVRLNRAAETPAHSHALIAWGDLRRVAGVQWPSREVTLAMAVVKLANRIVVAV
jgi:hypothetical protein